MTDKDIFWISKLTSLSETNLIYCSTGLRISLWRHNSELWRNKRSAREFFHFFNRTPLASLAAFLVSKMATCAACTKWRQKGMHLISSSFSHVHRRSGNTCFIYSLLLYWLLIFIKKINQHFYMVELQEAEKPIFAIIDTL